MPEQTSAPRVWRINGLTYTAGALGILFALLLIGDFTWALKDRSVGMAAKLLFKQFGASDFLNGLLVVSIPSALGMIASPIVSYRSDRHRGRWGRRIPYLLFTTPIAIAGMVGMGFSPLLGDWLSGAGAWDAARTTLVVLGVFWMLFEFAIFVANAVFNAFINDVVPTELLGRFYAAFRIASLLAGILFSYWLFGWVETHAMWIFLGLGTLYGIGMYAMCLGVREGKYPEPPPEHLSTGKFARFEAARTYFRECFGNPYYILVFFAFLLLNKGFLPLATYGLFYTQALEIPMAAYGRWVAYSYAISALLAFPVGYLADRFHPLRVAVWAVAGYCACMVAGALLMGPSELAWLTKRLAGWTGRDISFATVRETALAAVIIAHCVVSGVYFTASASLALRLLPRDRFAQFNSAGGIVATVSNIIFVPFLGWILDVSGNDYRYLLWFGAAISLIGTGFGIWLYYCFRQHGGVHHYVPPPVAGTVPSREG